jgi:hypothetical protein
MKVSANHILKFSGLNDINNFRRQRIDWYDATLKHIQEVEAYVQYMYCLDMRKAETVLCCFKLLQQ